MGRLPIGFWRFDGFKDSLRRARGVIKESLDRLDQSGVAFDPIRRTVPPLLGPGGEVFPASVAWSAAPELTAWG